MQQMIVSAPYLHKYILTFKDAVANILTILWNLDQSNLAEEKVT